MPLTNEQSQRFKAALLNRYHAGTIDESRNHVENLTDNELSKIIWWCLHGTEEGQFDAKIQTD